MAAFPNPLHALGFGRSPQQGVSASGQVAPRPIGGIPSSYQESRSTYLTGHRNPLMFAWNPVLREPQANTQNAWLTVTAQAFEAMATSGWLAGGLRSARGRIIGEYGLHLNLKPWGGVISSDPKVQAAWARDVEGRFEIYARDPWAVDWGGRYPLSQLVGQALDQYFGTGEEVCTLPYRERPGTSHGTKLNVMPSSRLSQANGPQPGTVQGVTIDRVTGEPLAYTFDNLNYATGELKTITAPARNAQGRPAVLHFMDNQAGAIRGITPLAPALRIARQYDQLADASLTLALLQTIFAGTITSNDPTEDILRAVQSIEEQDDGARTFNPDMSGVQPGAFDSLMEARAGWYRNTDIDMGRFGRLIHLFPGEKLDFKRPEHPNSDYQALSKGLLAELARCLGITTYEMTGIYDGFTYTTAKMATDESWPLVLWRRAHLSAPIYQAVFEAWLEEDIIRGNTKLPGGIAQFYAQRALICRADWRGPPRPTADEEKTAKANQILRAEGWASSESITSEYGNDWVEVADSQAITEEYRREKKLEPLPTIGGGGKGAGSAMVADPKNDPNAQSEAAIDREARLVSALMRGDQAGVNSVLAEYPDEQYPRAA